MVWPFWIAAYSSGDANPSCFGALFILAGVIANMHIYFRPTSLFNTLVMLILFVDGLGFMARALRPYGGQNPE